MPLDDYGALIHSGMGLVPDYQEQQQKNALIGIQQQQAQAQAQQVQLAAQKQQQAIARQQQFQAAFQHLSTNPTSEGWSQLMGAFPEFSEGLKRGADSMDADRKQADIRGLNDVYYPLSSNRPDLAAASLQRRIAADKAAGQDTTHDEAILEDIKSGDPARVKSAMVWAGGTLQTLTGKDILPKAQVADGIAYTPNTDGSVGVLGQLPGADVKVVPGVGVVSITTPNVPILGGAGPSTIDGSSVQQGGGDQASGGAGSAGGTPRSIRNNNPGNIVDAPFTRSQPGYKGKDKQGFAIFETSEQGKAAGEKLLTNYIKGGRNTISQIVDRWASSSPPDQKANYKQHIANRLGTTINAPVTTAQVPQIFAAKSEFESGRLNSGHVPTASKSIGGKTYVQVNGQWYEKAR